MKFITWLFTSIWVAIQIMTGSRKVMALKAEKPPVPLVVFRQSSRFLIFWPMVLLTWIMAFLMWRIGVDQAGSMERVVTEGGVIWKYLASHPDTARAGQEVPWLNNPFILGGWWAVITCVSVLVLRVRMKAVLTVALIALVAVFYFFLEKIGKWVFFIEWVRNIKVFGNWAMYALLAAIPTVDVLVVWVYARFHYFIATPNKGFLVWGMYASEKPVEYSEHDFTIDVDDVVERTFGFGSFILRPRSNPSNQIKFPGVWRISRKMSRFNELTTELRVKTIKAGGESTVIP